MLGFLLQDSKQCPQYTSMFPAGIFPPHLMQRPVALDAGPRLSGDLTAGAVVVHPGIAQVLKAGGGQHARRFFRGNLPIAHLLQHGQQLFLFHGKRSSQQGIVILL